MKKTIIAGASALVLTTASSASAQIYLTEVELNDLITENKAYEGTLDGVMAGETVRFTVNGARSFAYEFVEAGEEFTFTDDVARAGGRPDGNPALNHKQPDQDEVRFEWLDDDTVQFEFWEPGKRAGAQRNNPADAKGTLRVTSLPGATTETVSVERQEAREAATTILPVGSYRWAPFGSTLSMMEGGAFREDHPGGTTEGYFVKSGSELCFDVTDGNCYEVTGPDGDGVYTLATSAKKLNSYGTNQFAGRSTTLTPAQ